MCFALFSSIPNLTAQCVGNQRVLSPLHGTVTPHQRMSRATMPVISSHGVLKTSFGGKQDLPVSERFLNDHPFPGEQGQSPWFAVPIPGRVKEGAPLL